MIQNPEGRIIIRVTRSKDGSVDTRVESSRPLGAIRWFAGKSADETLQLLPLLYRVCGVAQSAAAVEAVEQACGLEISKGTGAARTMLVEAEILREHLLRIFTGWQPDSAPPNVSLPGVMRLPVELAQQLFPAKDPFRPGGSKLHRNPDTFAQWLDSVRQLVSASVLGRPTASFLQLEDPDSIATWAAATETAGARLVNDILHRGWASAGLTELKPLPLLEEHELEARLGKSDADEFVGAPDWRGELYETGAFARTAGFPLVAAAREHWGDGLLARILARLAEVASAPDQMHRLFEASADTAGQPLQSQLAQGTGIGQVEAARGRLVHRVVLDGDQVASYRMLAPTEWNFHPQGIVVQALNTLSEEANLERLASLLVEAVDPCVGYDLQVEAGH